jgi:hypothetical protein
MTSTDTFTIDSVTGLSEAAIVRAATNDPALSTTEVTLGDRTFKIVDLPYKDYLAFLVAFKPLLGVFMATAGSGLEVSGLPAFDASDLITYCSDTLPEMVRIVCKQTDPTITVDEVMELGKTPFKLANIVLIQVQQNQMIKEITDFFGTILALMPKKTKSQD